MKRILVFCFAVCCLQTRAQIFTPKADLPQPLERSFSFMLDDKLYTGTGRDNEGVMTNHVWQYDVATDAWTPQNDFPTPPARNGLAMVIDGTAYAGLVWDGVSSSGVNGVRSWYRYAPQSDTWIPQADVPDSVDVGSFAAVFELNGIGYAVCGSGINGEMNKVAAYDPVTDSWTQKNDFPGAARDFAFGVAIGNYAYVGLGDFFFNAPFYSDCYQYDPVADSWTPIAPIPPLESGTTVSGACFSSCAYNGKVLLMNVNFQDGNSAEEYASFFVYDPPTDTWTIYEGANMYELFRATPVFGQYGPDIYLGGGQSAATASVAADFWQINLADIVLDLTEKQPEPEQFRVTTDGRWMSVAAPEAIFRHFDAQGLSLNLYGIAGQVLARFPLTEPARFDLSGLPGGPVVWAITAGNRPIRSGKTILY